MSGGEDLRALSNDLRRAPAKVGNEVRDVINKGGLQIKKQMQREMRRSRWFGQVAQSIDYDEFDSSAFGARNISVEVGPNKSRSASAALAGIAYFGSSRPGGATVPDPMGALEAEAQEAQRWIQKIAGDVL